MRKNRRFTTFVAAGVGAALALAGCGSSSSSGGKDSVSVAYSSPVGSQPSQQALSQGLKAGAKELGWKLTITDANLSADNQVSNVQTMIQQQSGAIGLWPLDPGAMEGTFAQAKSAHIPVIAVNTQAANVSNTVWWGFNLCDADSPLKQAAANIAKVRPGAKVIVMGGPPVPSIQANVTCFSDAAKAAGLTIVNETDNTKDTSANAATLTADLFGKYKNIDVVWAYNDSTALGASTSAIQAGYKISDGTGPGLIVQGANGDPDAIEAIKQGRLTGTWDPNSVATGEAVIKAMKDARDGKVGKKYVVKATYYDKSNISTYKRPEDLKYTLDNLPITVS